MMSLCLVYVWNGSKQNRKRKYFTNNHARSHLRFFFFFKKKTKASENKSKIKVMKKAPANKRLLRWLPTRFFLDQQSAWLNFCSFLRNLKKEFIRKFKLHEVLQQCYNSSEFGPIWFCTYRFETQQTSTKIKIVEKSFKWEFSKEIVIFCLPY